MKANKDRWKRNNPGKAQEQAREFASRNAEKIRGYRQTERYKKLKCIRAHRRRKNLKASDNHFTVDQWDALCNKYDNRCLRCKKRKKLTVDHVMPLVLGGSNDISNIQPLCMECNMKKHVTPIDYRTERDEVLL